MISLSLAACLAGLLYHYLQAQIINLHDGWWCFTDVTRTTFYFKRRDDLDSSGKASCYESYTSHNLTAHTTFCYPNLLLTGYAKSGTSNLHQIIKAHRYTFTLPKELCPANHVNRTFTQWLFYPNEMAYAVNAEFFNLLPTEASTFSIGNGILNDSEKKDHSELVIFSSCIDVNLNLFANRILRSPHSIYLFIIRDYADWLWAAYNYWCKVNVDEICSESGWTEVGVHIRSPELFDDYVRVRSAFPSTNFLSPSWFWFGETPCYHGSMIYRDYISRGESS